MSLLPNHLSQFSASRQRKLWSTFIFGAMLLRMSRTHSLQPFFSAQSPSVKCVYSWTKIDTFVADDGISADKGSLRIEQKLGEDFCSLSFRITSEDLRASETVGVPPHFLAPPPPPPYLSLAPFVKWARHLTKKTLSPQSFRKFWRDFETKQARKIPERSFSSRSSLFGIMIIYVTLAF